MAKGRSRPSGVARGRRSIFWLLASYRFGQKTDTSCSSASAATALAAAWEMAIPWQDDRILPGEDEIIRAGDNEERLWWEHAHAGFDNTNGFLLPAFTDALSDVISIKNIPVRMERILSNEPGFNQIARELFKKSERRACVLILNHDQAIALKDSCGHYALMGAYNEAEDRVLVFEVDRFGIGHYWVAADRLLESMAGMVPETGMQPRGIMAFWPDKTGSPVTSLYNGER